MAHFFVPLRVSNPRYPKAKNPKKSAPGFGPRALVREDCGSCSDLGFAYDNCIAAEWIRDSYSFFEDALV